MLKSVKSSEKVYTSNNWSPYDVKTSVKSILTTRDKPRINPDDRKYLEDLFQESNSKLESFLEHHYRGSSTLSQWGPLIAIP